MAESTSSEDLVFVLDNSYSMFRSAFGDQNRILKGLFAVERIINKKIEIDKKDRYDLVLFGDKTQSLNKMVFTSEEIMKYAKNNLELQKNSFLASGLSKAVQSIINQKRFIGQKVCRVMLISDGLIQTRIGNPIEMAKVAKELGIIIDVLRFGPARIPGNIMRKISDITGGKYYYASSNDDLLDAVEDLAEKKKIQHTTIFDKDKEDSVVVQEMMYEIAADPLMVENLTEEQKEKAIYGLKKENGDEEEPSEEENGLKKLTCTICYSNKDMNTKTSFFGTGRFCPNCMATFHLGCAIEWSKNQQQKKVVNPKLRTFRCPHCFYLMKVPNTEIEQNAVNDLMGKKPKLVRKPSKNIAGHSLICANPECAAIINEEEEAEIYQCNACNSVYHVGCGEQTFKNNKRCAYCNKRIDLES